MTDRPTPDMNHALDQDAAGRQHALLGLHSLSGAFGSLDLGLIPELRPAPPGESLRAVAEAPEAEIPVSARVAVLYGLAQAKFPDFEAAEAEYRRLAASVAEPRGLDVGQLLTDLKQSSSGMVAFRDTPSGRSLPHHESAFIGEDVCTVKTVRVGGLTGTWVFSEFETDAPFSAVRDWVDPRNWPERGPLMFKRMDVVGAEAPIDIPPRGDAHWHGVFHEEVQLVKRLNTLLHCDYWQDRDQAAGMTYELDLSLDGELDVDRGFLLVNDMGPVRRVKALKIVGFTTDIWDRVAKIVCPFWTDWVRGAVRGGTTSVPKPGTHAPATTGTPGPTSSWANSLEAWVEFFGDSARTYLDLFGDVTSRMTSQGYSSSDWMDDGRRYWSQLAKDWAQAWTYGQNTLDQVAREGLDTSFIPPGRTSQDARAAAPPMTATSTELEGMTIPVPGLGQSDRPSLSDLVSIEAGGATLSSTNVIVTVQPLDDGTYGVRLQTSDTTVPPGLYVGQLTTREGQTLAPVQLYLSRARGA
jgi:hypothetical protein